MKIRALLFFSLLWFVSVSLNSQTLSANEAYLHIGETATVCGLISGEHTTQYSTRTPRLIRFEKPYPHQAFTVMLWAAERNEVGNFPTTGRVCVSGLIEQYHAGPQMTLHSAGNWFIPSEVPQLDNNHYYKNSAGQRVHSPAHSPSGVPPGASAECRDGTYSFSQSRSGTCSHHGGVSRWLQ